MRAKIHQILSANQALEFYQKLDQELQVNLWRNRFGVLRKYAPGPTKWIQEMKTAQAEGPEAVSNLLLKFEQEETRLDNTILEVIRCIKPVSGFSKIMVMACGTGWRIPQYLGMLTPQTGTLFGVDMTPEHVEFTLCELKSQGETDLWWPSGNSRYEIREGLATDPVDENEAGTFDIEDWSRFGNHVLKWKEFYLSLKKAVRRLRIGGKLVVSESFTGSYRGKELNKNRKMSKGSKFRTIKDYIQMLTPQMRMREDLIRETSFADDDYLVVPFEKVQD